MDFFSDDDFDSVESPPWDDSFEDRINIGLENTISDKSSTPRYPCYLKDGILEVCVSGADFIFFDGKNITTKFSTLGSLDVSKIDKNILKRVIESFSKKEEKTFHQKLIEKYNINSKRGKLTEKQIEEISKYEQRKKGHWK